MLKKFIFLAIFVLSLFVFFGLKTAPALALYNSLPETGGEAGFNTAQSGEVGITSIINVGVKGFLTVMAIAFLALMLYAGIRWLTARGVEEHITKAQETLQTAVIGLIIIVGAYAITSFVLNVFEKGKAGIKQAPIVKIPPAPAPDKKVVPTSNELTCAPLDFYNCSRNPVCEWVGSGDNYVLGAICLSHTAAQNCRTAQGKCRTEICKSLTEPDKAPACIQDKCLLSKLPACQPPPGLPAGGGGQTITCVGKSTQECVAPCQYVTGGFTDINGTERKLEKCMHSSSVVNCETQYTRSDCYAEKCVAPLSPECKYNCDLTWFNCMVGAN